MPTWPSAEVKEQIIIKQFHSLFEVQFPYLYDFPGETHNFWEIVYLLKGSLTVTAESHVYTLSAGDIIFHKPLEFHKLFVPKPEGVHLIIILFTLEGNYTSEFKNKIFNLNDEQKESMKRFHEYLQSAPYTEYDTKRRLWDFIFNFKNIPTFGQMVNTYIYQLLLSLVSSGNVAETLSTPDTILFKEAVNYMNSQITRQPSVEEISAYCNTSKASLERLFKKHTGIGIHKYFLKLRLNTASVLLQEGLSVKETADKLGFSSQSYFSNAYKRETGIWPTEIK